MIINAHVANKQSNVNRSGLNLIPNITQVINKRGWTYYDNLLNRGISTLNTYSGISDLLSLLNIEEPKYSISDDLKPHERKTAKKNLPLFALHTLKDLHGGRKANNI